MAPKKTTPRLKNYTSGAADSAIFEAIRKSLATHRAKRIIFDYDDEGRAISIQFSIEISKDTLIFQLPARLENVEQLVQQSHRSAGRSLRGQALRDQAYKTAWANIRDWLAAQMALIDAGMVQVEEVFLPYLMIDEHKTFYEAFAEQRALPQPQHVIITEEQ